MSNFKKGDAVYYYSKQHGTIPAVVRAVGKTDTKRRHLVWVKGESPSKSGFINAWVHTSKIELQADSP